MHLQSPNNALATLHHHHHDPLQPHLHLFTPSRHRLHNIAHLTLLDCILPISPIPTSDPNHNHKTSPSDEAESRSDPLTFTKDSTLPQLSIVKHKRHDNLTIFCRRLIETSKITKAYVPPTSKHLVKEQEMRRSLPNTMNSLGAPEPYRAFAENEGDSHSSTSNSPARPDYEESDFYAGNNDSQSSIGVPTFQDMAVTEEICEPTPPANRLPAEVLINIFSKLNESNDLLNCMGVSKLWARNCVDQLWHRPSCTTWPNHSAICKTLSTEKPYFAYRDFVKRLNLASLAQNVNDGSVLPLAVCDRVERLTLTKCVGITDSGLTGLLQGSDKLLALDISEDVLITGNSMNVLADNCRLLQGLNIMGCTEISNESMIRVAQNCAYLKRVRVPI